MRARRLLVTIILLHTIEPGTVAQQVLLRGPGGREEAQGAIRWKRDECFVLVPSHAFGLAQKEVQTGTIVVLGRDGTTEQAHFSRLIGDQLAVLEFLRPKPRVCETDEWLVGAVSDSAVVRSTSTLLERRLEDGTLDRSPVRLVRSGDPAYWTVARDPHPLMQTESGSGFIVDGQRVGLLQSVNADTGYGQVQRLETAEPGLRLFFTEGNARDRDSAKIREVLLEFKDAYTQGDDKRLGELWRVDRRDIRDTFTKFGRGQLELICGPIDLRASQATQRCHVSVRREDSTTLKGSPPLGPERTFIFGKRNDTWVIEAIR